MKTTLPTLLAAALTLGLALPLSAAQDYEWNQAELESISAAIQEHITELRGEEFSRPVEVKLASSEDFYAYANSRIEDSETPEKLAADELIAKLLGLVPPDMNLMETMLAMLETQVGGYYDPASDSFSLMSKCPRSIAPIILAHELDHALDDQLFGIDEGLAKVSHITDASTSFSAVVEGSGTNIMTRWMMQYSSWAEENGGALDLEEYARMQESSKDGMLKAPMIMWKPMLLVYMRGASFLVRSDSAMAGSIKPASSEDIRAAFTNPPLSTEQILHPEKYWDAELRDDPRPVAFDTSELPSGWEVLREDRMGEAVLAIVTTPNSSTTGFDVTDMSAQLGIEFTSRAAEGWGGDALILVGKEDARYMRLVTVWDTERDAGEFMGALSSVLSDIERTAGELGSRRSGATLEYGDEPDEVILSVYFGLSAKDLRALPAALTH